LETVGKTLWHRVLPNGVLVQQIMCELILAHTLCGSV
jgi:hypothetical protein